MEVIKNDTKKENQEAINFHQKWKEHKEKYLKDNSVLKWFMKMVALLHYFTKNCKR